VIAPAASKASSFAHSSQIRAAICWAFEKTFHSTPTPDTLQNAVLNHDADIFVTTLAHGVDSARMWKQGNQQNALHTKLGKRGHWHPLCPMAQALRAGSAYSSPQIPRIMDEATQTATLTWLLPNYDTQPKLREQGAQYFTSLFNTGAGSRL
jgi:hypothetical protein